MRSVPQGHPVQTLGCLLAFAGCVGLSIACGAWLSSTPMPGWSVPSALLFGLGVALALTAGSSLDADPANRLFLYRRRFGPWRSEALIPYSQVKALALSGSYAPGSKHRPGRWVYTPMLYTQDGRVWTMGGSLKRLHTEARRVFSGVTLTYDAPGHEEREFGRVLVGVVAFFLLKGGLSV